jgi:hypothetical protein
MSQPKPFSALEKVRLVEVAGRQRAANSGDIIFNRHLQSIIGAARRTGRPLDDADFVATLQQGHGRTLAHQVPGRKPNAKKVGFETN